MIVCSVKWCRECRRDTDHYLIVHGWVGEWWCDVCETPAVRGSQALKRELVAG
jgi:hypothetical protein